jgi:hypothetical protein
VVYTNGSGGNSWPYRTINLSAGQSALLYMVSYSSSPTHSNQFDLHDNVPPAPPWSPVGTGYLGNPVCSLPVPWDLSAGAIIYYDIEEVDENLYRFVPTSIQVEGDTAVNHITRVAVPLNTITLFPNTIDSSAGPVMDPIEFNWYPGWPAPHFDFSAYFGSLEGTCHSANEDLAAWDGAPTP